MAPIVLFVHARPDHTKRTIESLLTNPEAVRSELHIFCDGARDRPGEAAQVEKVRSLVRGVVGFSQVILNESTKNRGLGASIISGISHLFELHDRLIVLEDDLLLSPGFLAYMNQALETYSDSDRVLSISGFSYPIRFSRHYPWDAALGIRASSWGWATWKNRWEKIDWKVSDYDNFRRDPSARRRFNRGGSDLAWMLDRQQSGQINSWAIRFCYHQFKHGLLDVFPVRSLVENIGWGADASNCEVDVRSWRTDFWFVPPVVFRFPNATQPDPKVLSRFASFNSLAARGLRQLKRMLWRLKRRTSPKVQHTGFGTVLVSNFPTPYREPVFQAVAKELPGEFTVIYSQPTESDHRWQFPLGDYSKKYLKGKAQIWRELSSLDPAVVITNGYKPSHLLTFLWAKFHGKLHVAMTDGWLKSEQHLAFFHPWLRKYILGRSAAFLGASNHSLELLQHDGAKTQASFLSYRCANNALFAGLEEGPRPFDLMFSGQFIERKMPGFFVEVARRVHAKLPSLRLLMIGDGPLRESTLKSLDAAGIAYDYRRFLTQEELPSRYASAKLLLFPTLQECWGVVANEACAAGTPVITCDNTALDGELVHQGENGLVLPLDAGVWADEVVRLLEDRPRWQQFSSRSKEMVSRYDYEIAARGILSAIQYAQKFA